MDIAMSSNITLTENGDAALSTSGNHNLDFFTRITRSATFNDYIDAFTKAWKENKETAFQVLMNMRDVRNGKGEKLIPIVLMVYLKFNIEPHTYEAILRKMLEYGCWKDVLRIVEIGNRLNNLTTRPEIRLFAEQLARDTKAIEEATSEKKAIISLCAKWAPSEDSHYDHHPMFAAKNIMNIMGFTPKEYRLCLSKLRKHLGILEMLMSTQQFDLIDFSKIPSMAITKMKHAFSRDTNADGIESEPRKKLHMSYTEFLRKLTEGKTKVNIKGIQPHELVSTYIDGNLSGANELVEGQWAALKQRIKEAGAFRNVTAIVDVSSSMTGQPMQVSIALGILVAECTTGPFHGKVITFQSQPSWHHLIGKNLMEQVKCMKSAPWGGSTNMRATFDLILNEAVAAELTQEEMVKTLFIFTDMQFNSPECGGRQLESTFEYAQRAFTEKGYQLPRIVCWNLRTSSNKTMPVSSNEQGYAMLSGFSAELLKCILNAQEFSPVAMMMHVLEPYDIPTEISNCSVLDLQPVDHLEKAVNKSAIKKSFKPSITKPSISTSGLSHLDLDLDSLSDSL
jgi:hypothetical protein